MEPLQLIMQLCMFKALHIAEWHSNTLQSLQHGITCKNLLFMDKLQVELQAAAHQNAWCLHTWLLARFNFAE